MVTNRETPWPLRCRKEGQKQQLASIFLITKGINHTTVFSSRKRSLSHPCQGRKEWTDVATGAVETALH